MIVENHEVENHENTFPNLCTTEVLKFTVNHSFQTISDNDGFSPILVSQQVLEMEAVTQHQPSEMENNGR